MNLLLDTNLLLIYNRGGEISRMIEAEYRIFDGQNNLAVSVATVGEIRSILYQSGVGLQRVDKLDKRLKKIGQLRIDLAEIISKYVEIDAFSQGRYKHLASDFSARNMGKIIGG